ncbi:MAG: serine/threonine-protein kinase [Verrucomicrobiota bacterium]
MPHSNDPDLFALAMETPPTRGVRWQLMEPHELDLELADYEVKSLIASGGMGAVYLATDLQSDSEVAVKVLPPALEEDPVLQLRFRNEADVLTNLNHPNIVSVQQVGETESGLKFFVMEHMSGGELNSAKKLSLPDAIARLEQICDGLAYAHSHGILHRDLKPSNLLLSDDGQVKISDFGLARRLNRAGLTPSLTLTGTQVGTPHYMAPELLESDGEVTVQSEIYSLGVVFYQLLTGKLPVGRYELASKLADVPTSVDRAIDRMLAIDPEKRFETVEECREAIRTCGEAEPRRIRSGLILAMIAVVTLAAVLILRPFGSDPATPAAAETPRGKLRIISLSGEELDFPQEIPTDELFTRIESRNAIKGWDVWFCGLTPKNQLYSWGAGVSEYLGSDLPNPLEDVQSFAMENQSLHVLSLEGRLRSFSTDPFWDGDPFPKVAYRRVFSGAASILLVDGDENIRGYGKPYAGFRIHGPKLEEGVHLSLFAGDHMNLFVLSNGEIHWGNRTSRPRRIGVLEEQPRHIEFFIDGFIVTMPDGCLRFWGENGEAPLPFAALESVDDAERTELSIGRRFSIFGAVRRENGSCYVFESDEDRTALKRRTDLEEKVGKAIDLAFGESQLAVLDPVP